MGGGDAVGGVAVAVQLLLLGPERVEEEVNLRAPLEKR
jgi:hypothetical protein